MIKVKVCELHACTLAQWLSHRGVIFSNRCGMMVTVRGT